MKSLRTRFFLDFAVFGFVVALGVGLVMYVEYYRYIRTSYTSTLESLARMIEGQFPVLADPDRLTEEAKANSPSYWQVSRDLQAIVDSFGLAYIYLLVKEEQGYVFILDTDDLDDITDAAEVFKLYPDDEVPGELDLALRTGQRQISAPYTDEWGTFVSLFCPLPSGGKTVSIMGLDYDLTFVRDHEKKARFALTLSLIPAFFLSALAALLVSRSLLIPLREIAGAGKALAALNFDVDIPIKRKDEIGDMQRSLNLIRNELKKTLNDINNEHLGQKNISDNLHVVIRESSGGLEVITRNMDSVQEKTGFQMKQVIQTSESLAGIIKHIHILDDAVETQGKHIDRSSESIGQMVRDIESVRGLVAGARETTARLGGASEAGRKMLKDLTEELSRIAEQSAFLEEANDALVNIAAQTSILAMNAAIEAAHAGEAGKGFAVVAGEVRSLAELSDKESASISREIKTMRDAITRIHQMSADTVETMGTMFREVTDMQGSFSGVSSAVEAQASSGDLILSALSTLRDTADQVKTGSEEIERESASIHDVMESLESISKEVNDSVLDVQKACREIAESLEAARKIAEGRYLIPPETGGPGNH